MANEIGPDDVRELWRNQPVDPARMSASDLQRKAASFEAKVRRWFRAALALLAFLLAGYASFLYFFPGAVHRIGATLTLAGLLYGAHQLLRRGPARRTPAGPVSATCAAYRAELERQREFHLSAWSRLVAFVPGAVVFISGFVAAEHGPAKAAGLAAGVRRRRDHRPGRLAVHPAAGPRLHACGTHAIPHAIRGLWLSLVDEKLRDAPGAVVAYLSAPSA